jgi:hypothetical protein
MIISPARVEDADAIRAALASALGAARGLAAARRAHERLRST